MNHPELKSAISRNWLIFSGTGVGPWPEASRPGGVVLALNFQGDAEVVIDRDTARRVRSGTLLWMRDIPPGAHSALRLPSERHECLCLFYSDHWLRDKLDSWRQEVPSELRALLLEPNGRPQIVADALGAEDRAWARGLMAPHLCDGARLILESARMAELFVRKLFGSSERNDVFLTRTKRMAMERVTKVREILQDKFENPPTLADLARQANCNPHYLSRTFSAEEGLTISAYIRRLRIERAAELIANGRCNVSEAALEVGYQSVAHFTRAFTLEKGVVPSHWVRTLRQEAS